MKINTISTYVLVYLLTNGHWNLMVPVKADGGSTGGSDAGSTAGSDAGSTAGSDVAEVSTLGTDGTVASPANEADGSSSSAGADAGSSLPSGSSGESADGGSSGEAASTEDPNASADASLGSSGESASTDADASADASLGSSGESADGAASADPDGSVAVPAEPAEQAKPADPVEPPLLNGMYPDFYSSGMYGHKDYSETNPELLAKREEAKRLAADMRKTADELLATANELTGAILRSGDLDVFTDKMGRAEYKLRVAEAELHEVVKPPNLMYNSGFPDGHHHHASFEALDAEYTEHRKQNTIMNYSGFPTGWHFADPVLFVEAKKYRDNKFNEELNAKRKQIEDKENQIKDNEGRIAENETLLAHQKEALEEKTEELSAKKQEVSDMKTLITELQRELADLESQARALVRDQSTINIEYKTLLRTHKNLEEEHSKLEGEHKALKKEDVKMVSEYRALNAKLDYIHGHKWDADEVYNDSSVYENHFPSAAFTTPGIVLEGESGSAPETHTASPVSTATPASETSSAGQAKIEEAKEAAKVADGSVAAPAVPVSGSTEAKPVAESPEAKAPEAGAKVEQSAPVSTAAPSHTAGHAAVPGAKTEAQAAPAHTAGHAAVPEAKAEAQAAPTGVKFYKTGSDGSMVEMVENTDFEKKITVGDDRFDFKTNAKCEKITFDGQDVWKKGDQDVNEPRSVTYRDSLKVLVVRDNEWTVNFKKDNREGLWKLESKTQRAARTGSAKTASTPSSRTGLASPGLARPAGGSTTNLASSSAKFGGSVSNLDTASTTGSDESKSSGSTDVANLKDVEDDTSGSASAGSGGTGSSTLRGTGMAGSSAGKTALATPAKKLGQQ
nr:hypothetical protein MACL_00003449 [Theileria orientalis]